LSKENNNQELNNNLNQDLQLNPAFILSTLQQLQHQLTSLQTQINELEEKLKSSHENHSYSEIILNFLHKLENTK
jgi:uncharacterized protein YlxW (UPF0749 family)